jgi:outer membrane immunogenic protein
MKKLWLVAVAGLALSTSVAFAADLGQPYVKAPPAPPPPPSWTGFYIGVNGGWGFNRDTGDEECINPAGIVGGAGCHEGAGSIVKADGGLAGGQIGYNWQSGIVVYGIETDIQWADIKDTASVFDDVLGVGPVGEGTYTASQKLDWFGTVRGRLGITPWSQSALLYVTGGLIYGQEKVSSDVFFHFFGQDFFASDSTTRTGGTVGVGLEYLFTPNLSGKIEGLWYDMGTERLIASPLFPNGFVSRSTFHFEGAIVRAGLNWHFNWGGGGPGPYQGQY